MRHATGIVLEHAIAHILDTKHGQGLTLSERSLPLDDNRRLSDYLVGHIERSLQDAASHAARFRHLDGDGAGSVCKALIDGSLGLVEGSQCLAKRLYKVIEADNRISPCDLVICLYKAANKPEAARFVALLKIDPTEVFRHKTVCDEAGRRYVGYDLDPDVLPSSGERLQKCAFVQPIDPRPPYDMLLLDRQVGAFDGQQVAKFFLDTFLEAELALAPQQATRLLYRGLVSAHKALSPELTPGQDRAMLLATESAVTMQSVNLDAVIESLPLDAQQKARVDEIVSERLPDREVVIDPAFGGRLTQKVRYTGDFGLKIEVDADAFQRIVHVDEVHTPGSNRRYIVTIETERWTPVAR